MVSSGQKHPHEPLKLGPRSFWDLGTIFAALLILARFGLGRTGLTGRVYRSDR